MGKKKNKKILTPVETCILGTMEAGCTDPMEILTELQRPEYKYTMQQILEGFLMLEYREIAQITPPPGLEKEWATAQKNVKDRVEGRVKVDLDVKTE